MTDRNHELTDEVLRRQLAALPPASPPAGDWDRLERRLDQPTDATLRAALNAAAAPVAASGWTALADKLDATAPADARVAEALNGLQPAPPPGGWAALTARMDADNAATVDGIVADKIGADSAAPASGWAALAARLEMIGQRREQIAAGKITELALMTSFMLLLLRFLPLAEPAPVVAAAFPLPLPGVAAVAQPAVPNPTAVTNTKAFASPAPVRLESPTAERASTPALPVAAAVLTGGEGSASPPRQVNAQAVVAAVQPTVPAVPLVARLPLRALATTWLLPQPMLTLPTPPKKDPVIYYADGFLSLADVNMVGTPNLRVRALNIEEREDFLTHGISAGLSFDAAQGRHALQIGVVYSRVGYTPTDLNWFYGSAPPATDSIRGYTQFEYQAIEAPLNYRYVLTESPKWRISARAGMSLRVVAISNFQGREDVQESFDVSERLRPLAPLPPGGGPRFEPAPSSDKAAVENPEAGWWQGGSVLANSSFYLNTGIVVERLLNPRWSLYAAPTFNKVIYLDPEQGIGPYGDRINVGSLRLGTRYRFGK